MSDNSVACIIALFLRAAAARVEELEGTTDKYSIAEMIRRIAEYVKAGNFNFAIERMCMTHEKQKTICVKHGLICFEDHRRHKAVAGG